MLNALIMWRSAIKTAYALRVYATKCRRRLRAPSLRRRLVVINLIATGVTFLLISLALIANEYLTHVWTLLDDLQVQAGQDQRSRARIDRRQGSSGGKRAARAPRRHAGR